MGALVCGCVHARVCGCVTEHGRGVFINTDFDRGFSSDTYQRLKSANLSVFDERLAVQHQAAHQQPIFISTKLV